MRFRFHRLRVWFRARAPLFFPPGEIANRTRGGFGKMLKRVACPPSCTDAKLCDRRSACLYARAFEPTALEDGPSGLRELPRPFVFRTRHLDGRRIERAEEFPLDVHVFDIAPRFIGSILPAFAYLALEGLRPGWGAAELARAELLKIDGTRLSVLFDGKTLAMPAEPLTLTLDVPPVPIERVCLRFVTPVEIKGEGFSRESPQFGPLFARVRDRISNLARYYGGETMDLDYRAIGERSRTPVLLRADLRELRQSRTSYRTGQTHPLNGMVGEVEYAGDLTEFLPWLEAARWAGVGRQTVWGKGEIEISKQHFGSDE